MSTGRWDPSCSLETSGVSLPIRDDEVDPAKFRRARRGKYPAATMYPKPAAQIRVAPVRPQQLGLDIVALNLARLSDKGPENTAAVWPSNLPPVHTRLTPSIDVSPERPYRLPVAHVATGNTRPPHPIGPADAQGQRHRAAGWSGEHSACVWR